MLAQATSAYDPAVPLRHMPPTVLSPERRGRTGDAEAVIILLRDGLNALDRNRSDARAAISLAYEMLRGDRSAPEIAAPAEVVRGGLAPWQMRRATHYIDQRLEQPISVADIAAVTRLSTTHFARGFKRSFRMTPHAYLFKRRIERAQELMLSTREPLAQIALACGFADQGHLSRRFRQGTGSSPQAWRRERLSEADVEPA